MNEAVVYFVATIIVVGIVLFVLVSRGQKTLDFKKKWQHVEATFAEGSAGQKQAVTEADKLLDAALKELGFGGETMGERLKSARQRLGKHNDSAWSAHKLRNKMVHEANYSPSKRQCSIALKNFKASLKQLGVSV